MKKLLMFALVCSALVSFPAWAADAASLDMYDEQLERGTRIIEQSLPDSARDFLDGGVFKSGEDLTRAADNLLNSLGSALTGQIGATARLVGTVAAALILSAAVSGAAASSGQSALEKTVSSACAVLSAASVCVHASGLISQAAELIKNTDVFLSGFVPVFTGVLVSQGRAASSAVYAASVTAVCAASSALLRCIARPAVGVIAGLSAVSPLNEGAYASLVTGLKKTVMWVVGISTTVFLGFTGLKTSLAASGESLSMRTASFVVSSSVPIVGASVNEAVSTVHGSLAVVRAGLGAAGIIGLCAMYLPAIAGSVVASAGVSLCCVSADILGLNAAAKGMSMMKCAIDIVTALMAFGFIALTACTAMMLGLGG